MYRTYNARPIPRPLRVKRSARPLAMSFFTLIIIAAYIGYALLRPLPDARLVISPPVFPGLVRVNIPWPAQSPSEQAAIGADGYGLLTWSDPARPQKPVPIASIAKAITALAVLDRKPLVPGEQGPAISITQHDLDIYNKYVSMNGSVVPVYPGETITEYQALQALMLPSANNISDTLAEWAFGSLSEYNAYANSFVRRLGMASTTVTDASGFAPATVSTASDLVRLGDAVLDNAVLAGIVSQKQADFPHYGVISNVNTLLGQSGIRGIKTGNTDEAGGCLLAAADVMIGNKKITVITAVLNAPDLQQAMRVTMPLIQSAPAGFQTMRVVRSGQAVGVASTPWGNNSPVIATKDITVTAWAGRAVAPRAATKRITTPAAAHTAAGTLSLDFNGKTQTSDIILADPIGEPGLWWRLSHPL